jgi:hypothetical protein
MSQIEVVILNWAVQSVFQKDYTGPFIQLTFSSLFGAFKYWSGNGFQYMYVFLNPECSLILKYAMMW